MTLTAGEILRLARLEHPALTESIIPNPLALRLLDKAQRELAMLTHRVSPWFLSKSWWVHLKRGDTTYLAGAGTDDGWPVRPRLSSLERSDLLADSLAQLATNATIRVPEFASSAANDTTITKSGAAWTTNEWANKIVVVKKGHAEGQKRVIISNTSDTLTFTALTPPAQAGDIAYVVDSTWAPSATQAVMQDLSTVSRDQAYYVKVDANGVVTVDVLNPIESQADIGAPVPPNYGILASWAYHDGQGVTTRTPAFIGDAAHAAFPVYANTVYLMGQRLYLAGHQDLWRDVDRIELRYCPIPPAARTLADILLFPDELQDVLAQELAAGMGVRVAMQLGDQIDVEYFGALRDAARGTLDAIVQNNYAASHQRIVEAW